MLFRLSGTEGATLRVYLEQHEPDVSRPSLPTQTVLAPLIALTEAVAEIRRYTGMNSPSVCT